MLTASNNLINEDWVQCWLDKLTPKQKALVTEVLEDSNKPRKPTQAAFAQANAALGNSNLSTAAFTYSATQSNFSTLVQSAG